MTDIHLDTNLRHSQAEFISVLQRLCAEAKTGTLFIVTVDGTSATIGIQNGTIVSLNYRNILGVAALAELRQIEDCKLRFTPKILLRTDAALPPTDAILADLANQDNNQGYNTEARSVASPTALQTQPAASLPATDYSDIVNVARVKTLAKEHALRAFGPVGPALVSEKLMDFGLNTSLTNIERALTEIADEIGETDKVAQFVSKLIQALQQ